MLLGMCSISLSMHGTNNVLTDADPHFPLPHITTLNQHKKGDNCLYQRFFDSWLHQHVLIVTATPPDKDERSGSATLHLDREGMAVLEGV